jgi:hypothetical protein
MREKMRRVIRGNEGKDEGVSERMREQMRRRGIRK